MSAPTVTGSIYTNTTASSVLTLSTTPTVAPGLTGSTLLCFAINSNGAQPQSATWMGAPMTPFGWSAGIAFKQGFYLHNPAPGTGSCTVNWGIFSHNIILVSFVSQNGGAIDVAPQIGGFPFGTFASEALTTANDNELLIGMIVNDGGASQTLGAGQTSLSNLTSGVMRMSTSSKAAPAAGSQTMSATLGGTVDWDMAMVAIGAPTGGPSNMFLVF